MMSLREQGLWPLTFNESQRRYVEELVKTDVAQLASDIVSAETGNRPIDAAHLRLAYSEALQILAMVTLPT